MQQRAALAKHRDVLEQTAKDISLIYIEAHATAALQIIALPIIEALGGLQIVRFPPKCALTPAQRELMIVRNMKLIADLEKGQKELLALRQAAAGNPTAEAAIIRDLNNIHRLQQNIR